MNLVDVINKSWGWAGFKAQRVRAQSPMGHLLISDADEQFFYLDTDGMSVIALGDQAAAQAHLDTDEAKELWFGGELLAKGLELLGEPEDGSVITLKPLAMLQGDYAPENLCIMPLEELIRFSGESAKQLKDLPEGTHFSVEITD
jgi:hypothetical protein